MEGQGICCEMCDQGHHSDEYERIHADIRDCHTDPLAQLEGRDDHPISPSTRELLSTIGRSLGMPEGVSDRQFLDDIRQVEFVPMPEAIEREGARDALDGEESTRRSPDGEPQTNEARVPFTRSIRGYRWPKLKCVSAWAALGCLWSAARVLGVREVGQAYILHIVTPASPATRRIMIVIAT